MEQFANALFDSGLRGLVHLAAVEDGQLDAMTASEFKLLTGNGRCPYYAVITIKNDGVKIAPREAGI